MRNVHTLVCSWNRAEREDWNCIGCWSVSHDHSGMCPSLRWVPVPDPLASWPPHLGKDCHSLEERSTVRDKSSSDLEQHLSSIGTAITGTYAGSAAEEVWVSECGQSHHKLCLDPCQKPTADPFAQALLPSGARVLVLGGGEYTLKSSRAGSDLTPRASSPVTWDPLLQSIVWCWLLRRREAPNHTWLWP